MDLSNPFKLSITVDIMFPNDSICTYYGFVGEREWDGGNWMCGMHHDAEMERIAEALLDRYAEEIMDRAMNVTVAQLFNCGCSHTLLDVEHETDTDIRLIASLDLIEE